MSEGALFSAPSMTPVWMALKTCPAAIGTADAPMASTIFTSSALGMTRYFLPLRSSIRLIG